MDNNGACRRTTTLLLAARLRLLHMLVNLSFAAQGTATMGRDPRGPRSTKQMHDPKLGPLDRLGHGQQSGGSTILAMHKLFLFIQMLVLVTRSL